MLASSCNDLNIYAKPKKLEDQLLLFNNHFIRLIRTIVFYNDLALKGSDNFLKFFPLYFYL